MTYSLSDFFDNFEEKIISLGVSTNFKNSPSWKSIISGFKNIIEQAEINDKEKTIVHDEEKRIFFQYNDQEKDFDFTICCFGPNEIVCQIVNKKDLGIDKENNQKVNILYIERVISEYKDNGEVSFESKMVTLTNKDCEMIDSTHSKEFIMQNFFQAKYYNEKGIVVTREAINYKPIPTSVYSNYTLNGDDIPLIAISHFDKTANFSEKTKLVRDKLDTAYFYLSSNNIGIVPIEQDPVLVALDSKNGLQDMTIASLGENFDKIPTLTSTDIENLILKEDDYNIQEGLRLLAVGRNNPSYGIELESL